MSYPASKRLRIGRYSEYGRLYFLTCSVENREPLFHDLWMARAVVQQFRLAQEEGMATSLAWVVMPDHIHWLVELHETQLEVLMRRFKSRSAYVINRIEGPEDNYGSPDFMTVHCGGRTMSLQSPATSLPIHYGQAW